LDKIKAISVFKTFSKKELSKFQDFLNSPYFNHGKKYITRFYKELIKHHPEYNDLNLIKEKVYSKLYPGEEYSDERFRKELETAYERLAAGYAMAGRQELALENCQRALTLDPNNPDSGGNPVGGVTIALTHPHLEYGGTIEVRQFFGM
jgi:tetratricopeptide (TPR) repeat protein